jgi:hypothetical protein
LTGHPLRLATISAMTDSCRSTRQAWWARSATSRSSPKVFIVHLGSNAGVEGDLVDQHFNSSEKRLARVLLLMANFGKGDLPSLRTLSGGEAEGGICGVGMEPASHQYIEIGLFLVTPAGNGAADRSRHHLPQHATHHIRGSKRNIDQAAHQSAMFVETAALASHIYDNVEAWVQTCWCRT